MAVLQEGVHVAELAGGHGSAACRALFRLARYADTLYRGVQQQKQSADYTTAQAVVNHKSQQVMRWALRCRKDGCTSSRATAGWGPPARQRLPKAAAPAGELRWWAARKALWMRLAAEPQRTSLSQGGYWLVDGGAGFGCACRGACVRASLCIESLLLRASWCSWRCSRSATATARSAASSSAAIGGRCSTRSRASCCTTSASWRSRSTWTGKSAARWTPTKRSSSRSRSQTTAGMIASALPVCLSVCVYVRSRRFLSDGSASLGRCLTAGEQYDLPAVFRLCQLWFTLGADPGVNAELMSAFREAPSAKFLVLGYQIASRMSAAAVGPLVASGFQVPCDLLPRLPLSAYPAAACSIWLPE
jgi:hypothetical protein